MDDDPLSLESMEAYLKSWELRVETRKSGQEALQALRESFQKGITIDSVIIDKRMPEMDGFQLAEIIQKEFKHVGLPRLILVTAYDHAFQEKGALSAGFSAYLTKPVKRSDLYQALFAKSPNLEVQAESQLKEFSPETHEKLSEIRILVVEDNSANQILAKTHLQNLGYQAQVVANGLEALEAHTLSPYDLILMDCQMPEMDGYEATRKIRLTESIKGRRTPIIALTANALEGDADKCFEAGMDDYLSKPFSKVQLKKVLEKWLSEKLEAIL